MKQVYIFFRRILLSDVTGNIIRTLFRGKIWFQHLILDVSSKEIKGRIVAQIFFQHYEREEAELVRKYLEGDRDIVELGSSTGAVATLAGKHSEKKLICVEANSKLIDVIKTNLTMNGIDKERIFVAHGAISDREDQGKKVWFAPRGSNELGRISEDRQSAGMLVPTICLSRILSENNIREYTLISDIEGAEVAFLFDDVQSMDLCKQLFIELHAITWKGRKHKIEDLVCRIKSLGFELVEALNTSYYFRK